MEENRSTDYKELQNEIASIRMKLSNYERNYQEIIMLKDRLDYLENRLQVISGETTCGASNVGLTGINVLGSQKSAATDIRTNTRSAVDMLGSYDRKETKILLGKSENTEDDVYTENDRLENNIGTTVMSAFAAILIFIGLCSLGVLVYDSFTDTMRAFMAHMISFILIGLGYWRVRKHKDIFSLSLTAIGIGSVYIALYLDSVFNVMSIEVSLILMIVFGFVNYWIAYKNKSMLFMIISYIGFNVAAIMTIDTYDVYTMAFVYILQLIFCAVTLDKDDWKKGYYYTIIGCINYICLGISTICLLEVLNYKAYDIMYVVITLIFSVGFIFYILYTIYKMTYVIETNVDKENAIVYIFSSMFAFILPCALIMFSFKEYANWISLCIGVIYMFFFYYVIDRIEGKLSNTAIKVFSVIMSVVVYSFFIYYENRDLTQLVLGYLFICMPIYTFTYMYSELKDNFYLILGNLVYGFSTFFTMIHVYIKIHSLYKIDLVNSILSGIGILVIMLGIYAYLTYLHKDTKSSFGKINSSLILFVGYPLIIHWFCETLHVADITSVDGLIFEVITIIGLTLLVLFITCTSYSAKLSVNYFRKLEVSEGLSPVYLVTKFINYFLLIYVLLRMYQEYEGLNGGIVVVLLCSLVLVLSSTKYTLELLKDFSGFILGPKFTIYIWAILHIFLSTTHADLGFVYSLLLLSIAIICIVGGFKWENISFRYYGLILSIISVLKFVFVDISYDNSIYRIISYIIAGLLCLGIVFIYNTLNDNNKEVAEPDNNNGIDIIDDVNDDSFGSDD